MQLLESEEYILEIRRQAKNPPDPIMGACYSAVAELVDESQEFRSFFSEVTERNIQPAHLANLFYRAIQFIELSVEKNDSYPESPVYSDKDGWKDRILEIYSQHEKDLRTILLKYDTTTTIYQRYLGSLIILNNMFPGQEPLNIADFGCGGNHGLRGLSLGIGFKDFVDNTPGNLASSLAEKPLLLGSGLAIDKEDPKDVAKWREACSFYPSELRGGCAIHKLREFELQLESAPNVKFLKGDLLNLDVNHREGTLPYEHFDAVLLNTILYQLKPDQVNSILTTARKCLTNGGAIVVQDFAKIDETNPRNLDFDVNWFGKPGMYGTFVANKETDWEFKHLLRWGNGRCISVEAGPDFNFLLKP